MFIADDLCSWFVSVSRYGFRSKAGHCRISKVGFWGLDTNLFLPGFIVPLFSSVSPLPTCISPHNYFVPYSILRVPAWEFVIERTSLKIPFPGGTSIYSHAQRCLNRKETRRKICYEKIIVPAPGNSVWIICAWLALSSMDNWELTASALTSHFILVTLPTYTNTWK